MSFFSILLIFFFIFIPVQLTLFSGPFLSCYVHVNLFLILFVGPSTGNTFTFSAFPSLPEVPLWPSTLLALAYHQVYETYPKRQTLSDLMKAEWDNYLISINEVSFQVLLNIFCDFSLKRYRLTNRPTNGPTDGPTDHKTEPLMEMRWAILKWIQLESILRCYTELSW